MTAIDTFADLLRTLDENPPLREALAVRILPPEVLELPQRLDNLAADMQRHAEQHAQANARQFAAQERRAEQHGQDNARQFAAQERRAEQHEQANKEQFAALTAQVAANTQQIAANTEQIAANTEQIAANTQQIKDLDLKVEDYQQSNERHFRQIENTLQYLKAGHARNSALRSAASLARRMGLRRVRNLTEDDLLDMTYGADTADLSANVLDSFHLADLVMETTDAAGETCYIAVEISFTADDRDTSRALRNAALLTRFTGKAARAAVAGIYQDNRIQPQIESGEVVWHRLRRDELEVE